MSNENVFKHHEFLKTVADEDVRYVLEKDRSYGASWKKSGGRSAWFMLKRKIDRMVEMMKSPAPLDEVLQDFTDHVHACEDGGEGETSITDKTLHKFRSMIVSEDIFSKILENPSGDDGCVLAEVRDLRRYLLLVEAEMMARGVVAVPSSSRPATIIGSLEVEIKPESFAPLFDQALAQVSRRVPRRVETNAPNLPPITGIPTRPMVLEDSNKHAASLVPWVVGAAWQHLTAGSSWFTQRSLTVSVLEPYVEQIIDTAPKAVRPLYETHDNGWILRIDLCPQEVRDYFPNLPLERNGTELKLMPEWQQQLYREEATKFVLAYPAWHDENGV